MQIFPGYRIAFIIWISGIGFLNAQVSRLDSLKSAAQRTSHDTVKVILLSQISEIYQENGENELAGKYVKLALALTQKQIIGVKSGNSYWKRLNTLLAQLNAQLAGVLMSDGLFDEALEKERLAAGFYELIGDKKNLAIAEGHAGLLFYNQSNYAEAQRQFEKAVKLFTELHDTAGMAKAHNIIGVMCEKQGIYPQSLEHHLLSLKLDQSLGNKNGVANAHNNIGIIYRVLQDYSEAMKNFRHCLELKRELKDDHGVATAHKNIGNVLYLERQYDPALQHLDTALALWTKLEDAKSIAGVYNNLGSIYYEQNKPSEALNCFIKSLTMHEEAEDATGAASASYQIGNYYLRRNQPAEARKYLKRSLTTARQIGYRELAKNVYHSLAQTDSASSDFISALKNYRMFVRLRDSLLNEENDKKMIVSQMKFDFEKKAMLLEEDHQRVTALANEQRKRRRLTIIFITCVALAVLAIVIVVVRSLRLARRQNMIIEKQKELVEEKQKEIIDSIRYAKRIQSSLLPTEKYISRKLITEPNKNTGAAGSHG